MSVDLTVPEVGESITEVQIGRWLKADGEAVSKDEDIVEIETEKASVVVAAPRAGVLAILLPEGDFAEVGTAIARIEDGSADAKPDDDASVSSGDAPAPPATGPGSAARVMPAARKLMKEHGLEAAAITPTGRGGRILKEDVVRHVAEREARQAARQTLDSAADGGGPTAGIEPPPASEDAPLAARGEQVRPMSMIRRTIAKRLVQAQQEAALLTTFNEVDMLPVKELRRRHGDDFAARHGVKLGFMSFFVRAAVEALRRYPAVNAEVRGDQIAYRDYHDVGIAIGGGKGLLVPVLRNAATLGFADIERQIADFAARAASSDVRPDELEGGTFTISNGGIYGSLLSTPIVNPPQSGILGMHAIQDRPVVIDGEIVVRPMMYVALTYDHRLVDGREAVSFLRTIKDAVEDPARLLLEV